MEEYNFKLKARVVTINKLSLIPCEKFKVSVVLFAGLEATVEVAQDFHRVVLRLLGAVLLVQSVETVNDDEHVL